MRRKLAITKGIASPDLSPMPDPVGKGIYFVNGRQSGVLTIYHTRTKQSFEHPELERR